MSNKKRADYMQVVKQRERRLTRNTTTEAKRRSMPLELRAVEGKPNIYECSFSSETTKVMRYDWSTGERMPEILLHDANSVDLAAVRDAGSILRNHDPNQIVGAPVDVGIDAGEGKGRCQFRFGNTQIAKDAKQDVDDKILRGISFGYDYDDADVVKLGRDVEWKHPATGRMFKGPAMLVTRWSVHEITLTPIPADPSVGVGRSGNPAGAGKETVMFKELILALCRAHGIPANVAEEIAKREFKTGPEAEKAVLDEKARMAAPPPAPPIPAPHANEIEVATRERKRGQDIRTAVRNAKLDEAFADEIVNAGDSIEKAREKIIAKLGERDVPPVNRNSDVEVGAEAGEKLSRHIEASIAHQMSFTLGRRTSEKAEKRETVYEDYLAGFKGVEIARRSLCDFARQWLHAVGFPGVRAMSREQIAQAVFSPEAKMRAIAANSTASLSNILANIQNKVMLRTYRRTAPTWQRWCRIGNLNDFKAASRLRMSDMADLKLTGEQGEIFDSQVSDEKESIQLANYARMISFTWESFVNDDLDALARLTIMATQAAARLPSRLVYTHLLSIPTLQDGIPTFHASHGNLDTTASALSSTNLNTAYKNMQRQTSFQAPNDADFGADPLDIEPRVLLIPPELRETGLKLTVPNPYVTESLFFKDLDVVIEPRLSNANYTGYSTTAYYLFASPDDIDTCEVAFLDGDDSPRMNSMEDFDSLAMKTRVYLPCAAKMLDYRGAHKSNGA